ncbi:Protein kinase domain-containing protein [Meloidogyne graminicola]|uniref:Protein kinase domain-containing protein n=1 Tax=Meloidogyne graminicola TaxID=189291 RepID=A0A8S9ZLF1_9BILA|nr:Protein kinase domain-containing protein [Meloidogyne graminicola]
MQLLYLLNILIFLLILNLPESFSGCFHSKHKHTTDNAGASSSRTHTEQGHASGASSSHTHIGGPSNMCHCGQYERSYLININISTNNNSEIILESSQSPIGAGGYSEIFHVYWPFKNKCFALKRYNNEFKQNKRNLKFANNEIEVLEYFNTLNDNERNHIIKIQGSSIDNPPNNNNVLKYIVMDLAGMNLEEYYNNNFNENDRELLIINIIKCAAKALEQFHKHGIHLDIKATNFVLPYGKQSLELCILIDFSGSVITKDEYAERKEFTGTSIYEPPEYTNKMTDFHRSYDIYSFGVMIYKYLIHPNEFTEVNKELLGDGNLDKLAKDCMEENPDNRPNINYIIRRLYLLNI